MRWLSNCLYWYYLAAMYDARVIWHNYAIYRGNIQLLSWLLNGLSPQQIEEFTIETIDRNRNTGITAPSYEMFNIILAHLPMNSIFRIISHDEFDKYVYNDRSKSRLIIKELLLKYQTSFLFARRYGYFVVSSDMHSVEIERKPSNFFLELMRLYPQEEVKSIIDNMKIYDLFHGLSNILSDVNSMIIPIDYKKFEVMTIVFDRLSLEQFKALCLVKGMSQKVIEMVAKLSNVTQLTIVEFGGDDFYQRFIFPYRDPILIKHHAQECREIRLGQTTMQEIKSLSNYEFSIENYLALRNLLVTNLCNTYLDKLPIEIFIKISQHLVPTIPTPEISTIIKYRRELDKYICKHQRLQGAND